MAEAGGGRGRGEGNHALCEAKIKSVEGAIKFLKSEHSATLSGLHEEIRRLQQRCSGNCFFY